MRIYKWLQHPRKANKPREPRSHLPQVRRIPAFPVFKSPPKSKSIILAAPRAKIKIKPSITLLRSLRTPIHSSISKKIGPTLKRGRTSPLLDIPQSNPKQNLCGRRSDRRRILFQNKIAGNNLRKSPGNGGTYNRTPESQTSCRS